MKLINRIALIITPKQPMLDWVASFSNETLPSLAELQQESSTYLLDEPEQEQPLDQVLAELTAKHYRQIWQSELSVWDEYLDNSPSDLSPAQFENWFEIRLSGLTFDLASQKLMVADVDSI